MSYFKFNKDIGKYDNSFTYSNFNECLSENTNNLLKLTNNYAKQKMFTIIESSSSDECELTAEDVKDEYCKDVKCCFNDICSSFNTLVISECNRLCNKIDSIIKIYEQNQKKIITSVLPKSNEYVLYKNFLKPNLDLLSTAINYPYINIIEKMLGNKITFTGEQLSGKQTDILSLIKSLKNQIEQNANTLKCAIPTFDSECDIDKIIGIKNKFKINMDGFKRINIAYDEYLSSIQFILNEYIKNSLNNENCKKFDDSNCQDKNIIIPNNDLDKSINKQNTYDDLGINECFVNIRNKSNAINAQLENISIKYGLEILTESGDNSSNNGIISKFIAMIMRLKDAFLALCRYIAQNWRNLIMKVKIMLDRYGKWADKHGKEILEKIDKVGSFTDTVCEWTWDGSVLGLPNLKNTINVIIPHVNIGSPISAYKHALDVFEKHDNSGQTKPNIYNTIMNKNLSSKADKLGLTQKLSLEEKIHKIVSMYQKDPKEMKLYKSDVQRYLRVLENSKTLLKNLNESDKMRDVNSVGEEVAKELDKVKSNMNSGKYEKDEYPIIMRYYSARKTVLDVAKTAASDLYQINTTLIQKMTHEAYKVLKNFLSKSSSNNESIALSSSDYIQLASLFEDSSELCMSSNLTDGGLISKDANINNLVPCAIPENIMNKILTLKMYPISKMTDGSILLRSDLDKSVWTYNCNDQSITCQDTLYSCY